MGNFRRAGDQRMARGALVIGRPRTVRREGAMSRSRRSDEHERELPIHRMGNSGLLRARPTDAQLAVPEHGNAAGEILQVDLGEQSLEVARDCRRGLVGGA